VLALVTWKLNSTGGYPIKSVSVIYQEVTDDDWNNPAWHRTYPEELKPSIVNNILNPLGLDKMANSFLMVDPSRDLQTAPKHNLQIQSMGNQ